MFIAEQNVSSATLFGASILF